MRLSTLVLALPALAAAEQAQVPILDQVKGWYNKAVGAISASGSSAADTAASAAHAIPNPVDAAAKQAEQLTVTAVTKENYRDLLKPGAATASPGIEDWMIYTTGGNRTCFGLCGHADVEWSKAVTLLSAYPKAPHLGRLDCETNAQLCNAWAASAPGIIYMQLPQPLPDQSTPATTVYYVSFNRTTVTAQEIASLATEEKYKDKAPYDGFFHPFDGPLAKSGLAIPFGWVVYGFSVVPSWAMMIGISFFSRSFMSKRLQPGGAPAPAAPAARR